MHTSEAINEIAAALSKAQGTIINPAKDSENPHFKSRYADLASGLGAIRPAFAAHGLSFMQTTRMDGDLMMLDTRIMHSSGQWMAGEYPVCKFPCTQQAAGSALTYARRYSLFAMAGVAGEDDDGNEASTAKTPAPPARNAQHPANIAPIRKAQALEPNASEDALNDMLATLDECETMPEINAWAARNAPIKDTLIIDHQRTAAQAFNNRKAAIDANKNRMAG